MLETEKDVKPPAMTVCSITVINEITSELDRSLIKDVLLSLSKSQVSMNAGVLSASHVSKLYEMCDSKLEKKWLKLVEERNHRLPDDQKLLSIISPSPTSFMPKVLPPSMWTVHRTTIPFKNKRMRK